MESIRVCSSPKTIVYSFVVADMFHYGHLQLLKTAKSLGEYHICGVINDEAVEQYKKRVISNVEERKAVLESIKCIDRVIIQNDKDPTENLKKIHEQYPDAKLILVHGNDWKKIPGREYIESIDGDIIQPEYYKRLSDNRIVDKIYNDGESHFENFTEHFHINGVTYYKPRTSGRVISTKADTLQYLSGALAKSRIEDTFVFRVSDWKKDRRSVIEQINKQFQGKVVIRSSAINEDSETSSMAGYYHSELNVLPYECEQLTMAINLVIDSYADKGWQHERNQVLVQTQTNHVVCSGVVFTCNPKNGEPYYIINYDDVSGRTDTVTSGLGAKMIELSRYANVTE